MMSAGEGNTCGDGAAVRTAVEAAAVGCVGAAVVDRVGAAVVG